MRRRGRRQTITCFSGFDSSRRLGRATCAGCARSGAVEQRRADRATLGRRERIDRSAGRRRAAGEFCRSFGFRQIGRSDRDTKSDARDNRLAPGRRRARLLLGAIPAHRKAIAGTRRDVLSARNVGPSGDRYRFYCTVALAGEGDSGHNRVFQAMDADPLQAMTNVLAQVEAFARGHAVQLQRRYSALNCVARSSLDSASC